MQELACDAVRLFESFGLRNLLLRQVCEGELEGLVILCLVDEAVSLLEVRQVLRAVFQGYSDKFSTFNVYQIKEVLVLLNYDLPFSHVVLSELLELVVAVFKREALVLGQFKAVPVLWGLVESMNFLSALVLAKVVDSLWMTSQEEGILTDLETSRSRLLFCVLGSSDHSSGLEVVEGSRCWL